jgi:hypothetical protein
MQPFLVLVIAMFVVFGGTLFVVSIWSAFK